ncbi:MAG: TonB-dependent receptor [Gemmatimonadales bacterium]|nr:TonB-dependent receptor [Gemmatimonadales bacterium]
MITAIRIRFLRAALAAGVALTGLLLPAAARAQTTTGSLHGYVRDPRGAPVASADVRLRNVATGTARAATSNQRGYYILLGLAPAEYELTIRQIGASPQTRRVRIAIGTALEADFTLATAAVALRELTVSAAAVETRTSEVATNVTQEQINLLPSADRNFLDLAVLAPGMRLVGDRIDDTRRTVAAGAQGADQINVFIDGASYKNDILRGGVAGQDASRGNPFPRGAIQEYRVLTQNYRAEYQKASSAIITATTRSGGNTWTGFAFTGYQHRGLLAQSVFQRADAIRDTTLRKPDYSRYLTGLSVGGPLIRDRLHLFASYEGNYQNRSSRVNIVPPTGFPALDTVNFASRNGEFGSPFRSNLFFGKLTYARSTRSSFEFSLNTRGEHDIRDFGGLTAFETATRFQNSVTTALLRHQYVGGSWLNEAQVSFQRYHYNPVPATPSAANRFYGFGCCAQIGSNVSNQDFTQGRLSLRNVVTWSGWGWAGSHVVKAGGNVDFLSYDIIKRNSEIPQFVYESWFNDFEIPERVQFQSGDPNFSTNNTQLGLFLQDDWSPTPRLTLNLGVRWDYESGMLNYDYVTPSNVRDSLTAYASRLFIPLDPNRYFTDGSNRSRFLGAVQPRLGFSYSVDRAGRTTVFGGWGLFYDRTLFDQAIEEKFAEQHPSYLIRFRPVGDTDPGRIDWNDSYLTGGKAAVDQLLTGVAANTREVKLLPNDLRPPMSNQFSLGVRQLVGSWALEAAYTGVRSDNTFTFYFANLNFTCPERSFAVAGCFVGNSIPGFGTILFADNAGQTWYNALQLKLDRPFHRATEGLSWGAGLAYNYAKRETQGFNDDFSFPNPADYPRQVRNDERHRAVAHWILESRRAWGLQFSGLATVASGQRLDVGDRFGCPSDRRVVSGTPVCDPPNPLRPGAFTAPTFTNVDLRLRKEFTVTRNRLGLTLDVFNAFNNQNLGCFNTFNPTDVNGRAGCVISDPQRLQVGVDLGF